MTTIYWTLKDFVGEQFEDHPHEGMICAMAIAKTPSGVWVNFTIDVDNGFGHIAFDSKEKAVDFIVQRNKPEYAKLFDVNYELEYVGCDSEKWYDLYSKYSEFVKEIESIVEESELPWWKHLLVKLKRAYIK